MVHANLVIDALTKGADGVLLCGWNIGECHYLEGNLKAKDRGEGIDLMLEDFGLEPERFRIEWIASSEAQKFSDVMTDMTEILKDLGPSPYSNRI